MSLLVAAVLAASTAVLPTCSWDSPGARPFMGDVVAAVDGYSDIPAPVRAALKQRMARRDYDDIAVIRRDTIVGKHRYGAELRDMHFGSGQVCRTITRSKWGTSAEERGLVYCEGDHCVIVPTVCRNVSRVTRVAPERTAQASPLPVVPVPATETAELAFEPPAAGRSFAQQADPAQPAALPGLAPGIAPGVSGVAPPGDADGGPRLTPQDPWVPGPSFSGSLPPPVVPIPEPGTWALWLLGLAGVGAAVRRRLARKCGSATFLDPRGGRAGRSPALGALRKS